MAEWLHVDDRLDKTGIGDFLGENEDFTKEVHIHSVCSLEPRQLKFQGNALVLRVRCSSRYEFFELWRLYFYGLFLTDVNEIKFVF